MAKITFDYISAAEKMAEKGDYESALHYYFLESNKSRRNEDVDVCIGDTYAAMGLLREAVRYYMRAYAEDQNNEDALNGLIFCFNDIDEDAALYYLNRAISPEELGDFEFSEVYDDVTDYPPLTVHDKRDQSAIMDSAFDMLEKGDREGAQEALKHIDKEAYQYCDSLLARASFELEKPDGEAAMALADEALGINPSHVGIHIIKIMAYDALGDKQNVDIWIKKLEALDPRSEEDVTKVALCLCNFNCYELAEKYLLRKLEFTPYDRIIMLSLGAVQSAQGNEQAAFKTLGRVCSLYQDDVEVKEIASRILSDKNVKMPFEMLALKKEWTNDIKKMFFDSPDDITNPENMRRIKWLLQGDSDLYLQSAVCAIVAGIPEYNNMMDELLIDPFAPSLVKKQILLRRVCDEKTKRVKFVISNLFRSLKVKHPDAPDNVKYAYYYVFIALAVMELHFERSLTNGFKKLMAKFNQCVDPKKEELPINGLAAMLYFLSVGGTINRCCEYFDCEEADFDNVAIMLDLPRRN